MTAVRAAPRWIAVVVVATWLATLAMALAILWVSFGTDFLQIGAFSSGATAAGADDAQVLRLTMAAFCAIVLGYASVGALLASRPAAGRIGAILLSGGALFALVPFGYLVGGWLSLEQPNSSLFQLVLIMGPVAIGPGVVAILPALAIAFPDGRLPSRRWRWPVAVPITLVGLGALVQLVRPGSFAGGPFGNVNPIGIDALPPEAGRFADVAVPVGIIVLTAMGMTAVFVRYRRGTTVERQQARWFVAAVALAALPLSLSFLPGLGGPVTLLIASGGLLLVPVAVGIAVTRYRLYEIDRLINRTLVYVPLTALVAGLYAGIVALLQRVFQSVTGDRSDAAIVISTLILASIFTPLRKWLEGVVDRRFKAAAHPPELAVEPTESPEWEGRVAAIALDIVRRELASAANREPIAVDA